MAWPLTPRTAYTAGTTPYIKADDLNAIQVAINQICLGTLSVRSLTADGTGGAAVAPGVGVVQGVALQATYDNSGSGGGAGNPSLPLGLVSLGQLIKPLIPIGWAVINGADGQVLRGVNVRACVKNAGAGSYSITFNTKPANPSNGCAQATPITEGACYCTTQDDGSGYLQANIHVVNNAWALADISTQVIVWSS